MKRLKTLICFLLVTVILWASCLTAYGAEPVPEELFRYGRSVLSDKEKYVYDSLYKTVTENESTTATPIDASMEVTREELDKAVYMFIDDHPELFWVRTSYSFHRNSSNYMTSVTLNFLFEGEELKKAKEAVETEVANILKRVPASADTNYEKALYIHDLLVDSITYEKVGEHQTAYGALVDKKCVCTGYAAAYSLLLQRLGIPASVVRGDVITADSREGHAWNIVWIDEDICVYTDVTHDDSDDGKVYHYYFNISRDEMNESREIDSLYTLPSCSHTDQGYFDITGSYIGNNYSVDTILALFGPNMSGKRVAVLQCASAETFNSWWSQSVVDDIYEGLEGTGQGSINRSWKRTELIITVTGTFPITHNYVSVSAGENMCTSYKPIQYVEIGQPMEDMVFYAHDGYYFPEDYRKNYSSHGVTVTRSGPFHVTVSGTPTADTALTLPSPSPQVKAELPSGITLTPTGYDTAILGGITVGMKYSLDGETWTDILSDEDVTVQGVSTDPIYVIRKGDGAGIIDSDPLSVSVSRAPTPVVGVTSPTSEGGKGSIMTTSRHEYSTDGKTWIACEGALGELEPGTYYVRVKADSKALASDPQKIVIKAYVAPATEKPTEKPTEAPTEMPTEAPAERPTEAQQSTEAPAKVGCGAFLGSSSAIIIIAALGTAVAVKRKED